MLRSIFGEREWVIPNERIKTGRSARKGSSRKGFASNFFETETCSVQCNQRFP